MFKSNSHETAKEQLALSVSHYRPVNSKAEKKARINVNSPERGSVGGFGMCLRLLGHRAVGAHFLSAGGRSVIQQALADLETPKPISAGDMPSTDTMLNDKKNSLFFKQLPNLTCVCSLCFHLRNTVIKSFLLEVLSPVE